MELERLSPEQFELFQSFIYKCCGIRVDSSKITLVSNRIRKRLKPSNCETFEQYYRHITSRAGASELEGFLDAITTNETSFFRTPSHFEWFKNEFIKEISNQKLRGKRAASLRVWSAACSTGEEPYSAAMCCVESQALLRGWTVSIVGSDISESALRNARTAIYSDRTMQELSPERLQKHFTEVEPGKWKLKPAVTDLVSFRNHNLMELQPLPPFDVIFLRNVLIYFDKASKIKVIDNLIRALAPGGFLVVGPSEGIYEMLGQLQKHSTFLYQKPLGESK